MNEATISNLIKQILTEKDRIFIPGFGTLLKSYIPARLDIKQNTYLPPSYLFELDRSAQYDDPYLKEVFAQYHQVSSTEANRAVNEFGVRLKKDLEEKGKAEIGEVITAFKEGNQVNVVPSTNIMYDQFPEVDLSNLWEQDESHSGLWWEFSAFFSMMLLILAGVYYMVNASKSNSNYPYSSNYPPLIGMEDAKVDSLENNLVMDMQEDQLEISSVEIGAQVIPESNYSSLSQDSVIIVGAFSRQNNIQDMKNRLQHEGWSIYEENVGVNLVRIGMVPEQYENINEVLGIVRETIEPNAWVLKKND